MSDHLPLAIEAVIDGDWSQGTGNLHRAA